MSKKKGEEDNKSVIHRGIDVNKGASKEDKGTSSGLEGSHGEHSGLGHQDVTTGGSLTTNAQAERPIWASAAEIWGPEDAEPKGSTRTDRASTRRTEVGHQDVTTGGSPITNAQAEMPTGASAE